MEHLRIGRTTLDRNRRLLLVDDRPVDVHARALAVLEVLALHPGEVIGKRTLIATAWPDGIASASNLMVQISRLRALLESVDPSVIIRTERGMGYVLEVESTALAEPGMNTERESEREEERDLLRQVSRLTQQCQSVALHSALDVLDDAIERFPRRGRVRAHRALVRLRLWHHGLLSAPDLDWSGAEDVQWALREGPDLALAHTAYAAYTYVRQRDFLRADVSFQRALEMAPNEAETHEHFADALLARGRFDEARAHLAHARWCQPDNVWLAVMDALALYLTRAPEKALARLEVALQIDGRLACADAPKTRIFLSIHDTHRAMDVIEDLHVSAPDTELTLGLSALCEARQGRTDEADRVVRSLSRGSAVARLHAAATMSWMDRGREAIDLLRTLIDQPVWEFCHLAVDPLWDRLRDHPEFESLLQDAGLKPPGPTNDPA